MECQFKRGVLATQVSSRMEFRAWRENKGNRRKNQAVSDLSPALPSPEGRVQRVVCKAKVADLKSGCGNEGQELGWN